MGVCVEVNHRTLTHRTCLEPENWRQLRVFIVNTSKGHEKEKDRRIKEGPGDEERRQSHAGGTTACLLTSAVSNDSTRAPLSLPSFSSHWWAQVHL